MTDLRTQPTSPAPTGNRRRVLLAAAVIAAVTLAAAALAGRGGKDAARTISLPSAAELGSVADARVFFGHQSVGDNILGGLPAVYDDAGVAAPRIVEIDAKVSDDAPFVGHAHVGTNGDPASKVAAFTDLLRSGLGDQADVALLKFCYVDVDSTTDAQALFDTYAGAMDALQQEYPGLKLIYTTVPLSTDRGWKSKVKAGLGRDDHMGPADNLVRERYNALVRKRYAATGRLFDIAKVESTNADGTQARRDKDGDTYHVLAEDLALDPGHLNAQGSKSAAAEFVRIVSATRGQ